jgi:hypothetical protein
MKAQQISTLEEGASRFHQPNLWPPELLPDVLAMSTEDDGETMEMPDEKRAASVAGETSLAQIGFAPSVRVDASRREIALCATSEAFDSHGTIFDLDASTEAFTCWVGNVREMRQRQAVGDSSQAYHRSREHAAIGTWAMRQEAHDNGTRSRRRHQSKLAHRVS